MTEIDDVLPPEAKTDPCDPPAWNRAPVTQAQWVILTRENAALKVENALLKAQPGQSLILRCGELEAENERLRAELLHAQDPQWESED